jgi:hypothetical protein
MSLRSVNLISIKAQFSADCCDKISFAADDTSRLAARGSLMVFLYFIRPRRTLTILYSIDDIPFKDPDAMSGIVASLFG